ncbi:MAG: type II secretion system GspH family protein [Fusobacterium sp.]|nr:type II secretion system GspH family protein [Fusobacterium sp.]
MAEILLSLTIIGVVAAITLPSLTGNINERTWNTQRKALYARFSQAIALMPSLNGYGTLDDTTDNAAETFITSGLSKVLKINNICDNNHIADCGIPEKLISLNGSNINLADIDTLVKYNGMFNGTYSNLDTFVSYSQRDTVAAGFETANGESILTYYNPNCQGSMEETSKYFTQTKMCANFIYDLNGKKGPNTMGKDIGFISVLYPTDSVVVAPLPLLSNAKPDAVQSSQITSLCREQESESRAPNIAEATAMFYNKKLIDIESFYYCTTSMLKSGVSWRVGMHTGDNNPDGTNSTCFLRCVKR